MSWIRVDDQLADHPKILGLGDFAPLAIALQVRALCWSSRYLTDGKIPAAAIPPMLAGFAVLCSDELRMKFETEIDADEFDWPTMMVRAGLWEPLLDGCYTIHDYLAYNPSRAQVLAGREAARERMQKQRGGSNGTSYGVRENIRGTSAEVHEAPAPAPSPTTKSKTTTKSKALVAPKSGATGQAIMTEFQQLLTTQHLNGAARVAKAKLVFAYWAAKWDHPTAVYDGKRRSRLEARLKENGDNVSELLWVIDGAKRDDWTDRGKYAGIEQLFRDRGAVERLAGMAPGFRNGEPHPMAVKYAGVPEKPNAVG